MWQGETRRKAVIKLIRTSFHWLRGERKEFFLFANFFYESALSRSVSTEEFYKRKYMDGVVKYANMSVQLYLCHRKCGIYFKSF